MERHFGECRGCVWKVTAILASDGETFGKSPPFWLVTGKRLGSHRRFGEFRGNVWEVTAVLASGGETFGKSPPFWRVAGKRGGGLQLPCQYW